MTIEPFGHGSIYISQTLDGHDRNPADCLGGEGGAGPLSPPLYALLYMRMEASIHRIDSHHSKRTPGQLDGRRIIQVRPCAT